VGAVNHYVGQVREQKKLALMRTLDRNGRALDQGLKAVLCANIGTIRAFAGELAEEGLITMKEAETNKLYKTFIIEPTPEGHRWIAIHLPRPVNSAVRPTLPGSPIELQGRRLELYVMERCAYGPIRFDTLVHDAAKETKLPEDKVSIFITLMKGEGMLTSTGAVALSKRGKQRYEIMRLQEADGAEKTKR
jgi:hypothetical protein